jgi:hypothetical protein
LFGVTGHQGTHLIQYNTRKPWRRCQRDVLLSRTSVRCL